MLVQAATLSEESHTSPDAVALSASGAKLHRDQNVTIWGRVLSSSFSITSPSLLLDPCSTRSPPNTNVPAAPESVDKGKKRSLGSAGLNFNAAPSSDANSSPKRPRLSSASSSTRACSPTNAAPMPLSQLPPPKPHTVHNKVRKKKHVKNNKERAFEEAGRPPLEIARAKLASSGSVPRPLDLPSLPSNKTGYEALTANSGEEEGFVLEELLKDGWDYLEWDGKESIIIEESETGVAVVVCVGRPDDPTYDQACEDAHAALCSAGAEVGLSAPVNPKRGRFPAFNAGMCYGHGPSKPYNLQNRGHEGLVQQLLDNPSVQRLAHAQSAALHLYHPKVYQHFHRRAMATRQHCPNLRPNFTRSAFCACALNMGPEVITHGHRDAMNCAYGFCVVTALGKYDPRKGGHLVIKELRLIIEFPPGAQILLPSAVFEHGNTGIQQGETRTSFTQYSPGALFRYVDNGFRTENELREQNPQSYADMLARKPLRWKMGLGLWSTTSEILAGTWEYGAGPIDVD